MDFGLDDQERIFAETIRRYAMDRWRPRYAEWDRGVRFGHAELREVGALGVLGIRVPEQYGGSDGSFVTLGLAVEEVARADFNYTNMIENAAIGAELLRTHADPALAAEWLPRIAAGEAFVAFALSEPSAGSDATRIRAVAREVDGGFAISGEKCSITFAGQGDVAVVFARTAGDGARAIDAFVVPLDRPGVTRELYRSAGGRLTQRGSLFFDEVHVPRNHRLGTAGGGFAQAMQAFDFNRALIALACLGAAAQSLDETVAYARTRTTFGKPLARHQAVAFAIAEHVTLVKAARAIAFECLWRRDRGLPHTCEAAMAKWMGPKTAAEAIRACLLFHGHAGYSADLPLEQRLRDVMGLEIGDGTAEIMKAIVARAIFGREYDALR